MMRIQFLLPKGQRAQASCHDLVHDALVQALLGAGGTESEIIGRDALRWTFAFGEKTIPLSGGFVQEGWKLTLSGNGERLDQLIQNLDAQDLVQVRAKTGEIFDFSSARKEVVPCVLAPGATAAGIRWLSPVCFKGEDKNWITSADGMEKASERWNNRLSHIAGRPTNIKLRFDTGAKRALKERVVVRRAIKVSPGEKNASVPALLCPAVLFGPEEDLRLAWEVGVGQKNRMGFGAFEWVNQ